MYCQKCGASNPDGATFCASCGASLQAAPGPTTYSPGPVAVQRKNPVVAAILSFLFFGAGYLYLGYRKILGVPAIAFVVIVLVVELLLWYFVFSFLWVVIAIIVAYDSYVKAKGQRGLLGAEPQYLYGSP